MPLPIKNNSELKAPTRSKEVPPGLLFSVEDSSDDEASPSLITVDPRRDQTMEALNAVIKAPTRSKEVPPGLIIVDPRRDQTMEALNTVIKYHLDGEGHASLKQVGLRQILLFIVALSGAELYATAADAYAKSQHASPLGRINYIVNTCIPALIVLYNSTELFLEMRAAEKIPKKLANYLINSFTPTQKNLENLAITIGSAISALPLAAVSYMYPIPGFSKGLILFQGIVVLIDNTILHLFPFKLAFSEPLYRLPSLPLEFIIQQVMKCRLSQKEREEKQLQRQINQQYQLIKQGLVKHLDQGKKLLSIYGFKFTPCSYFSRMDRDILDSKANQQHSPSELLAILLNHLHALSADRPDVAPHRMRSFFRTAVYFPGALWVISSCAGFLAAPVNEMTALTGSPVLGATLSIPPVYFLGVLLAFFGGNALQNTFDYLTDWNYDAVKLPIAFKLYPKTSALLIVISMYVSVFSYAASAQLIIDNFNGELEFLRPYLLGLAKSGLVFLGFTAMLDFLNNMLGKLGQYFGTDDARAATKLSGVFDQLKNSIQKMDPALLIVSMSEMNGHSLKSILNLRQEKDINELTQTLLKLQKALKERLCEKYLCIYRQQPVKTNNSDGDAVIKLIEQLNSNKPLDEDIFLNLPDDFNIESQVILKKLYQEYLAPGKILETLENISRERIKGVNNREPDNFAHTSTDERAPLLSAAGVSFPRGSIHTRFFNPGRDNRATDDSIPMFGKSSYMKI